MSTRTTKAAERSAERVRTQSSAESSRQGKAAQAFPAWLLEDIEEPDAWTLASFDDLMPREMA